MRFDLLSETEVQELSEALRARRRALDRMHYANGSLTAAERIPIVNAMIQRLDNHRRAAEPGHAKNN